MDSPKVCVTIVARNLEEATQDVRRAEELGADLLELRMDFVGDLEGLAKIRAATELSLIAANRPKDQGGHYSGEEGSRIGSLLEACDVGFDYVDLELTTRALSGVVDEVRRRGVGLILSYHDLLKTPPIEGLEDILRRELAFKPDICKIVGTVRTPADNLTYLNLLQHRPKARLVCFGMGDLGRISRVLAPLFGGEFTFASIRKGGESAPGQMTIRELREIYGLLGYK
ncbi:MAG: type I 3-dehydroquinate dehydratase [Candidatus Bathyarchaeia archaeon]